MKGLGENKKEKFHIKLYIPHGSDESIIKMFKWSEYDFFISHMVQMKGQEREAVRQAFDYLYIPHGSDESCCLTLCPFLSFSFISHMVQMKAAHLWLTLPNCPSPLYPTWFRWKSKSFSETFLLTYLYIPHGSDESCSSLISSWILLDFISHMVQMKDFETYHCSGFGVGFISHMVQMKATLPMLCRMSFIPLYPTWFRWKMWDIK